MAVGRGSGGGRGDGEEGVGEREIEGAWGGVVVVVVAMPE